MYILYLEDNQRDVDLTRRYLARHAPEIRLDRAATCAEAMAKLARCTRERPVYELLLTDMWLPDGDGLGILAYVRGQSLPIPVVVLTDITADDSTGKGNAGKDSAGEEVAVSALKGGAEDYITKRHDYLTRLPALLEKALNRYRAASSRASRPLRVLYAEPHPTYVDLTQRHLARHAPHIQLTPVRSAAEVLTHLAGEKLAANYDLLLLDYRMAGMTALELLKELEFRDAPKLPVVLVTGAADEAAAVQALRLGVSDYLVKNPGYLHQLPRVLENAYTQHFLQRERQTLFESEQRYRAIFETAPVVIFTKDKEGIYTSANTLAREIMGRDPVGYSDGELQEAEAAKQLAANDQVVLSQGEEILLEERVLSAKGEHFFLTRKSPLRDRRGSIIGLLGIALEISDRIRAAQQLQQQERLVVVGQMAAGIAHDFNNILAIIMLYTQMLQISVQQPVQQRHLATIYQQSLHAANLVQQILDFSRRSTMERVAMDVGPFVKELVKLWQRTLPESIRVELALDSRPLTISADPARLQQALMNMAINARDAMPEGGVLRLSISPLLLTTGQQPPFAGMSAGHWLCIGVGDSGTGIPPDVLSHIFDPFFTTKAPGAGTGLGLAQVYGIVHLLDGFIQVESQVGMGSLFTIYLPLVDQPVAAGAEEESLPPPRGHGEVILLVEDKAALREAMAEMLAALGYQVLAAENGRHALYLFGESNATVHLVVSDLVMPDMGGKELYQELAQKYSAANPLRMLLVTGYPQSDLIPWQTARGVIQWLPKPFTMETFAQRVAALLQA